MRKFSILLVISIVLLTLFSCENEESQGNAILAIEFYPPVITTWELAEIKFENEEWRPVYEDERHTLRFLEDSQIEFINLDGSCMGSYVLEKINNDGVGTRLTLKNLPCSVQEAHMWYSHLIISETDSLVITEPRLNPTALKSVTKYKYVVK